MTKKRLNQYKYLKRELAELSQKATQAASKRIPTLQQEITEIEAFINGIQRSDIRMIFHYRYEKGLSWKELSKKIYGYVCEQTPQKAAYRYLKKEQSEHDYSRRL